MKMNLQYFAEDKFSYTFDTNNTISTLATKDTQVDKDIEIRVAIPTQTKSQTITTNGYYSITPDTGKYLTRVSITANVQSYITVNSEADLPSTAKNGTIAIVVSE